MKKGQDPRQAEGEAGVRAVLEGWLAAARRRDVPAVMAHYTRDVVAYDAVLALRFEGIEAYARHWETCMQMCTGDLVFELHDVAIEAAADLAWAHFLVRCGTTTEEDDQIGWMRGTVALRRGPDGWRIAHEHYSAPFDPVSETALCRLQPDR